MKGCIFGGHFVLVFEYDNFNCDINIRLTDHSFAKNTYIVFVKPCEDVFIASCEKEYF